MSIAGVVNEVKSRLARKWGLMTSSVSSWSCSFTVFLDHRCICVSSSVMVLRAIIHKLPCADTRLGAVRCLFCFFQGNSSTVPGGAAASTAHNHDRNFPLPAQPQTSLHPISAAVSPAGTPCLSPSVCRPPRSKRRPRTLLQRYSTRSARRRGPGRARLTPLPWRRRRPRQRKLSPRARLRRWERFAMFGMLSIFFISAETAW